MTSTDPIPEWAVKAADVFLATFTKHYGTGDVDDLARLLVTVREKALREARMVDGLSHTAHAAICALIDKEPES